MASYPFLHMTERSAFITPAYARHPHPSLGMAFWAIGWAIAYGGDSHSGARNGFIGRFPRSTVLAARWNGLGVVSRWPAPHVPSIGAHPRLIPTANRYPGASGPRPQGAFPTPSKDGCSSAIRIRRRRPPAACHAIKVEAKDHWPLSASLQPFCQHLSL